MPAIRQWARWKKVVFGLVLAIGLIAFALILFAYLMWRDWLNGYKPGVLEASNKTAETVILYSRVDEGPLGYFFLKPHSSVALKCGGGWTYEWAGDSQGLLLPKVSFHCGSGGDVSRVVIRGSSLSVRELTTPPMQTVFTEKDVELERAE